MAAIVSGNSLGLLNSSLYVLGSQGALGQATQGRGGEQVYVNGRHRQPGHPEPRRVLVGRGPDLSLLRTYNSQGLLDGDNGDNWRMGVYRKVYNLTGTVNTAGSTVTRVARRLGVCVYVRHDPEQVRLPRRRRCVRHPRFHFRHANLGLELDRRNQPAHRALRRSQRRTSHPGNRVCRIRTAIA